MHKTRSGPHQIYSNARKGSWGQTEQRLQELDQREKNCTIEVKMKKLDNIYFIPKTKWSLQNGWYSAYKKGGDYAKKFFRKSDGWNAKYQKNSSQAPRRTILNEWETPKPPRKMKYKENNGKNRWKFNAVDSVKSEKLGINTRTLGSTVFQSFDQQRTQNEIKSYRKTNDRNEQSDKKFKPLFPTRSKKSTKDEEISTEKKFRT